MTSKFIHSADWQLGRPFAGVEDVQKRSLLQQERVRVLERIGDAARHYGAEFILVAGDLFDSSSAAKSTVSAACAAIGTLAIPVFAIPGNHDHGGPGSLWEQPFFKREQEQLAPNLRMLLAAEPVELDTAVLFPCPLLRRHESADTTAWLRFIDADLRRFNGKPRLVIAHGSVQGFGSQEDDEISSGTSVNYLDLTRLAENNFDYIALGDWHGLKQVAAKAWYSGTPELDRFPKGGAHEPGHVLAVTARRGGAPETTPIRTAHFGWHDVSFEFADDAGVSQLEEKIESLLGNRAQRDLLYLTLCGSLGIEATTRLEQKIESWQARLLRLKLSNETVVAPSALEIEALTLRAADPLISRVASKLVEQSAGTDEEAVVARIALRELHALCGQH